MIKQLPSTIKKSFLAILLIFSILPVNIAYCFDVADEDIIAVSETIGISGDEYGDIESSDTESDPGTIDGQVLFESEPDKHVPDGNDAIYDPQPASMQEVQAAIDTYETEYRSALEAEGFLAALKIQKPHWQYEVSDELMPEGYNCQLVDWDEDFGAEYYTFFPNPVTMVNVSTYAGIQNAINNAPADGTAYEIVLTGNVTSTSSAATITIGSGKNIIIKSSGTAVYTATRQNGNGNRQIIIDSGGKLTLQNAVLKTNTSSTNGGGGVRVNSGGTFIMESEYACVEGSKWSTSTLTLSGGGVLVTGGTFILEKGKIQNNSSHNGGGVGVNNDGTFTMLGGEITNNLGANGGGVFLQGDASTMITMTGGSIHDNSATYGGGVGIDTNKIFNMSGGEIFNNTTAVTGGGGGGGINVLGELNMTGGKIYGNTANTSGGGVFVSDTGDGGVVTMAGDSEIYSNHSLGGGGGVYIQTKSTFTMSGNSEIYENYSHGTSGAYSGGGGIFVEGKAIIKENTHIYSNHSATNGGGVYIMGTCSMESSSVNQNEADANGGGIYLHSGTFSMSTGTICDNTAVSGNGGGAYAAATGNNALTVNNVSITGNTAALDGGGIYTVKTEGVSGYSNINVSGAVGFSGNTSQQYYIPPDATTVGTYGLWTTITNTNSSTNSGNSPISRVEPVNNDDINVKTRTVTFYIDGSMVSVPAPQTVAQYCEADEPAAMASVAGWFTTAADANAAAIDETHSTNKWIFIGDIVQEDTTLYGATIVITWDFSFRKIDAAADMSTYMSTPEYLLQGAEFELYELICTNMAHTAADDHTDDSCWQYLDSKTSGTAGLVTFPAIESGTHLLTETKAPDGYQLPIGQWIIRVDADTETVTPVGTLGESPPPALATASDPSDDDATILVTNIEQYKLPATGSGGAFWFAILGGILVTGSVLLTLVYRWMRYGDSSVRNSLRGYSAGTVFRREVRRE